MFKCNLTKESVATKNQADEVGLVFRKEDEVKESLAKDKVSMEMVLLGTIAGLSKNL